jgi:hypothetical protein
VTLAKIVGWLSPGPPHGAVLPARRAYTVIVATSHADRMPAAENQ